MADIKHKGKKRKQKKKIKDSGVTAKITKVDPSKIIFNPRNPQKQTTKEFGTIVKTVKGDGQLLSVPLCREGKRGKIYCVDGEHRIKAYLESGKTGQIQVMLTNLTEKEADIRMAAMNNLSGSPDDQLLGQLFKGLLDDGTEMDHITEMTGFDEAMLNELIDDLDSDDIDVDDLPDALDFDKDGKKKLKEMGEGDGEGWQEYVFDCSDEQAAVVDSALEAVAKTLPPNSNNVGGMSLEILCGEYLAGTQKKGLLVANLNETLKGKAQDTLALIKETFGVEKEKDIWNKLLNLASKACKKKALKEK